MHMNKMKYCNINFEGCDCSGKTTLHKEFQKHTKYKYSAHDRAYMSMYVHELFFNRDNIEFWYNKLIEDLNRHESLYVVLLPDFNIIKERFNNRGDEFVNLNDIAVIYNVYKSISDSLKENKSILILNQTDIFTNINIINEKLKNLNDEFS